MPDDAPALLRTMWSALGGPADALAHVTVVGSGALPSVFAVSDLAAAATGAAGLAAAEFVAAQHGTYPPVRVDRRLSSFWFQGSLCPEGWHVPPVWDDLAGDYETKDGWVRLHTNRPHHRAAALKALGVAPERDAVIAAVAALSGEEVESAVVAAGGAAAMMRTQAQWAAHPQGESVVAEPLVHCASGETPTPPNWAVKRGRPLGGIRVLDVTRILAGPVATRYLAGLGADVLRIDPPGWDEPAIVPEVSAGKRCAALDLKTAEGKSVFERLLTGADILVHGLRPGALDALGFDAVRRHLLRPGLIDVSLDAYGWTGPWAGRRGYDSLVQMSSGIAAAGMAKAGANRPISLPVQALDHATGYLMAAVAIRGATQRLAAGPSLTARVSLARTAALLTAHSQADAFEPFVAETPADRAASVEETPWGPAKRLLQPLTIGGVAPRWDRPAQKLASSPAQW